jgi:hypothetical protein
LISSIICFGANHSGAIHTTGAEGILRRQWGALPTEAGLLGGSRKKYENGNQVIQRAPMSQSLRS